MLGRLARGSGYLAAGVFGWLVAFLAIAATVFAFSYLISGHWPILCAGLWGRGSAEPPPGPLDLTAVTFFGMPGATLAVGLWWVLGATTAGARVLRLAGLIPLVLIAGLAGWLSVGLSLCT